MKVGEFPYNSPKIGIFKFLKMLFSNISLLMGNSIYSLKGKTAHPRPSGSSSLSSPIFSILFLFLSFASLFLNHFLRPKFFYNAHHPFSSLSFLFFLTISHPLGVLMRSSEVTEDIKRVSSSFFFFPSFPRNTGIYIGRKSDSN